MILKFIKDNKMISHTLTNVQLRKLCQLQTYIDNGGSDKMVGLNSIKYWIGWYNITGKQYIAITKNKRIDLEPGLYNFQWPWTDFRG